MLLNYTRSYFHVECCSQQGYFLPKLRVLRLLLLPHNKPFGQVQVRYMQIHPVILRCRSSRRMCEDLPRVVRTVDVCVSQVKSWQLGTGSSSLHSPHVLVPAVNVGALTNAITHKSTATADESFSKQKHPVYTSTAVQQL